jgi:hypothetical protein
MAIPGYVPAARAAATVFDQPQRATPLGTPLVTCDEAGLRSAVANAADNDSIDLTACSTITLTAGDIFVNVDNLTLNGPGADALTIDGGASAFSYGRIFRHTGFGTLSISNMTLADAFYASFVPGSNIRGGCVYSAGSVVLADAVVTGCGVGTLASDYALGGGVYARGDLTLNHAVVSANTAYAASNEAEGGGVFVRGNFDATDSWIAGNKVTAPMSYALGGGITVLGGGDVKILRSTLSGNQAASSGGAYIRTTGSVDVIDSTISSNYASRYIGGAGIDGNVNVTNSTITGNTAAGTLYGVGLYAYQVTMQSSIVADNTDSARSAMYDVAAAAIHGADNLITSSSTPVPDGTLTDCPRLTALQDNGGPTPTHALIAGSPGIDAGSNTIPLDTDQRSTGFARTFGIKTDIGAYEWQGDFGDNILKSEFEVVCDEY